MLKPPCERRCEDRRAGCHASCEKYHEYATIVGDARDRRIKFKQTEELLYGSHRRRRQVSADDGSCIHSVLWFVVINALKERFMKRGALSKCSRCKRIFNVLTVRRCHHEGVNQSFGEHICYFCCKRCQFHTKEEGCGAIGCSYKKIKEV